MKTNFYSLPFDELSDICSEYGLGAQTASWLFNWHYKKNKSSILKDGRLSRHDSDFISNYFNFSTPEIFKAHQSEDKTVKFLIQLSDNLKVESVLIPFQNKYTLCISSQVGCSMKCSFCFTGTQGLKRNLFTEEIIGQYLLAKNWLNQNRPNDNRIINIVFMGQGEPLNNFDAVKNAAKILISQHGISMADHKITISTSGYLPGLKRWKEEMPAVNIALSLHSPFDEERTKLIPINQRYPLGEVLKWIDTIPLGKKRFVTYEYLVIAGFNDSFEHAQATGKLLSHKKAYINLIPFNPYPGSEYKRPTPDKLLQFQSYFKAFNIPVTLRTTKGDDILAACGQLKSI